MPRKEIQLDGHIERIDILDEDGNVDEDLTPDLDDKTVRDLYETMLLSRRFDERLLQWQKQGKIGTFAPAIGQEAAQLGSIAAIREDDWFVPSYRDTAAAMRRGLPLSSLILYDAGFNEGAAIPEDAKDLPVAVPVASQIPHAAGIAYSARLRDTGEVVLVYFGDGATSEGDFHESINFAGVHELPTTFVCENNQYAISTPLERQTAAESIAQKAIAYGVPGVQVDGNDLLAVYAATTEAVDRARNGGGPTLIECVTYRLSVHTTADDPSKYRSEDEVEEWERRDPIDRVRRYLGDRDVLDDDENASLEDSIAERIDDAWETAEERMEDMKPEPIFEHLYAEMPPYLARQRDAHGDEFDLYARDNGD